MCGPGVWEKGEVLLFLASVFEEYLASFNVHETTLSAQNCFVFWTKKKKIYICSS
jgi:hypothetical protein